MSIMYYSCARGAQPIIRLSYYCAIPQCAGSPGMDDPNVSSFLELPSPPPRAAIYILELFFFFNHTEGFPFPGVPLQPSLLSSKCLLPLNLKSPPPSVVPGLRKTKEPSW